MTLFEILEAAGIDTSTIEVDEGGHYDFLFGETVEYRQITQGDFKIGDIDDEENVRLDGKFIGKVE